MDGQTQQHGNQQSHQQTDTAHRLYLDQLLTETEAAEFLGYTVRALQNWRVRGGSPEYVKVSKRSIRYRRRDLIAWADSRIVSSTSEIQKM